MIKRLFPLLFLALFSCSSDETESSSPISVQENLVIDNETNLMWQNSGLAMMQRTDAIAHCDSLTFEGFDDWRLPTSEELSRFHSVTNANGVVPKQMFDHCAAEVTSDGYVRTKKGAELYGGAPGDPINFGGPANVRAVREL